jgi:hypothetical protein
MVKSGVLCEVWNEFLNIIYTSFGFEGLKVFKCVPQDITCAYCNRKSPRLVLRNTLFDFALFLIRMDFKMAICVYSSSHATTQPADF